MKPSSTRTYRTQLRHEQAQLTRRRILDAARRLLVARGYGQVTMQEIAAEAGVAYQTLYAQFQNKLQLAIELCDAEFPHVGRTVGLLAQSREAGDPVAWLHMMGTFARRLYEPCADALRFMRESGAPDLLARYRQMERRRLEQLTALGPQLEQTGRLRPDLSRDEAVGLVWAMLGPEMYEQLVIVQGWTPDRFESWLGPALTNLVLSPSDKVRRRPI